MVAKWISFLQKIDKKDMSLAFIDNERPQLAIDLAIDVDTKGICLNKKSNMNALGRRTSSVIRMVTEQEFPTKFDCLPLQKSIIELEKDMRWKSEDASPDSVIGILFLEALMNGITIPEKTIIEWVDAVDEWELTGNSETPDQSWVVLASALAHQFLDAPANNQENKMFYADAWHNVLAFGAETMLAGHNPKSIPLAASGEMLKRARAAFRREESSYSEKIARAEVRRLLLPVRNVPRQQSIDALFLTERELSGLFKVLARNDPNSPLGIGYALIMMERPNMYSAAPASWMTISIDPRTELDLTKLWYELEALETEAWKKAGKERPLRHEDGRLIDEIPVEDQPYRQCWWLTKDRSLIGSPYRQIPDNTPKDEKDNCPGSLLTSEDIKTALFLVFDPSVQAMVIDHHTKEQVNLLETIADTGNNENQKSFLSGRWAAADPIPITNISTPWSCIFPCALHAMAARTFGIEPRQALVQAGAYANQMDLVQLPGGFAVVTAKGSFLLDIGGAVSFDHTAAKRIFFNKALLAKRLDELQKNVHEISEKRRIAHKTKKKITEKLLLTQQQECTRLLANLASLRGSLNQPLATSDAGLQPFSNSLSSYWNIEKRISELAEQVDWLQSSARTTAELRIFRLGRIFATISFPFLIAQTTSELVTELITTYFNDYTAGFPDGTVNILSFGVVMLLAFLVVRLILWRDS